MAQQHYALVQKNGCHPLKVKVQPSTTAASDKNKALAKKTSILDNAVRAELEEIFHTYADLYPNAKLLEEKRQRDTLLQAASAASSFQNQQENCDTQSKKKPRRGFFTFLFGSRDEAEVDHDTTKMSTNDSGNDDDEDDDDSRLTYRNTTNDEDDGILCGTINSLDTSCIPLEVYNVARSHLTSTRMRRENPNSFRWGPRSRQLTQQQSQYTKPRTESESSDMFIAVGLGEIAELGGSHTPISATRSASGKRSSSSQIFYTSDRDELLEYAERTQQFDLPSVRGTVLSQNCIAVSWGFLDGITVFYRRRMSMSSNNDNFCCDDAAGEGWDAIWWLGPSGPVLESMTSDAKDLFHDDQEQPGSPLLKISDCVALHVEAPTKQVTEEDESIVVTLVISRLGGYIELVPLPTELWKGPILVPNNYRQHKKNSAHAKSKRGRHPQPYHYTTGENIASPLNTVALTTLDYHLDVQTLEVFRTDVNSESIWNNHEYPHGPPAEFLLCASGLSVEGGFGDTITFWAISTIFSPEESTTPTNPKGSTDFQLHSCLLEAIWTNTGSPVSIFATSGIMSRWRTPRQVELRDVTVSKRDEEESSQNQTPVTTLTTTAPIVSMQFSGCDGSKSNHSGPFLSVLDFNGGVQIFDCSVLARVAAQNMTHHEYGQYRDTESEQDKTQLPFHLVKSVVLRNEVATALQKHPMIRPTVGNFHWLGRIGVGGVEFLPPIVFILNHSRKLVIATFNFLEDDDITNTQQTLKEGPLKTSVIHVSFPASGAAISNLEDNSLSFVSWQIRGPASIAQTSAYFLKFFVLKKLQPMAIVETLARESKHREAIQSAKKLSEYEQNALAAVIKNCYKNMWEIERDVDSLKAINDEPYIIREALAIYESDISDNGLTLEKLRSVLQLALRVFLREEDEKIQKIRSYFVRLGTYELLSKRFKSEPSLKKFMDEFKELNLLSLSLQLAERGDVGALTIVLFRHRFEVHRNLLSILAALPLPLTSTLYCHLFPVVDQGNFSDFFLHSSQCISKLPWSHMPQYISETMRISTVFGTSDEMIVLEYNKVLYDRFDDEAISEALVASWFVKRAKRAQTFVGNADDVINLCVFGLKCSSPYLDESSLMIADPYVQELHKTWRTGLSLRRMLLDQVVSIDGDSINTDDLLGTNLVELLDLILGRGSHSSDILYQFREFVQPLVTEMYISSSNDNLDEALVAFCLKEAIRYRDLETIGAKRVLASAIVIAENSKASMHMRDRLVKQKESLIELVMTVTKEVSKNLDTAVLSFDDTKELIGSIWRLYETLPARLISSELEYELKIEAFYQDLVGMDILSGWPGCKQPFAFFNKRQIKRYKTDHEFEKVYCDVLEICKSFFATVTVITSTRNEVALFHDLLCDIRSLNEVCFGSSLDISTVVCKHVIPALLQKGYFEIVASYLGSDSTVGDKQKIQDSVLEYVDEAMFSERDDNSRISDAIKCQQILIPLLDSSLESIFQSNRRYLDASRFVSNVLFDGKLGTPLKPLDFKEMHALDAIEKVLQKVPECIGCGCSRWMDSAYARDANNLLRQAESPTGVILDENQNKELPDLPGGGVFHLATILGLESKTSALAVKCRVIHYALQIGLHGAAASIARTLIYDREFGSYTNLTMDSVILGAIAEVVSTENYLDQMTKKELCQTVLCRFKTKLLKNSEAFNTILRVSSNLDRITSRFNHGIDCLPPGKKEHLLSRPIARLYNHVLHEYNAVIQSLFTELASQTSHGLVNDSLMNALSRFTMYWCIHDSKTPKSFVDLRDKADFRDNLISGCALILQIPSAFTGGNCVDELQKIALDQATSVDGEESFETMNTFLLPDSNLVKKLTEIGFGDNEARRAVIMTGNAGYTDALGWAALHTTDSGINNPFFFLKPTNRKYVEEDSIRLLQKSLTELSRILEDPSHRSTILHNIANRLQVGNKPSDASDYIAETKADSQKQIKTIQPVAHKIIRQKKEQRLAENISRVSTKDHADQENSIVKVDSISLDHQKRSVQKRRRPPPPPPRAAIVPLSKCLTSATGTVSGRNIAEKSLIDREELRKRGQAALNKLRSTKSNEPGNRKRLIEEGRTLLLNHSKPSSTSSCQPKQLGLIKSLSSKQIMPQVEKTRRKTVSSREPINQSFIGNTDSTHQLTRSPNGADRNRVTKIDPTDKNEEDGGWDFDDF